MEQVSFSFFLFPLQYDEWSHPGIGAAQKSICCIPARTAFAAVLYYGLSSSSCLGRIQLLTLFLSGAGWMKPGVEWSKKSAFEGRTVQTMIENVKAPTKFISRRHIGFDVEWMIHRMGHSYAFKAYVLAILYIITPSEHICEGLLLRGCLSDVHQMPTFSDVRYEGRHPMDIR